MKAECRREKREAEEQREGGRKEEGRRKEGGGDGRTVSSVDKDERVLLVADFNKFVDGKKKSLKQIK